MRSDVPRRVDTFLGANPSTKGDTSSRGTSENTIFIVCYELDAVKWKADREGWGSPTTAVNSVGIPLAHELLAKPCYIPKPKRKRSERTITQVFLMAAEGTHEAREPWRSSVLTRDITGG